METSVALLSWPAFLKLLAHELRWKILALLARSDYCGLEVAERLHQPQNLVSYHLRLLATHQLVTERRSAADGRDIYYRLNLDLHPALAISTPQASVPPEAFPLHLQHPMRVLFLCTENSARSQMAEGILRHLAGNRIDVCSAGSQPSRVHPYAMQVLAQMDIESSRHTAKHLETFQGQSFDVVITVCDRMKECCPTWPSDPEQIHWSLPDPVALEGISEEERYAAFEEIGRQLMVRVRHFLLLIAAEQTPQTRTPECSGGQSTSTEKSKQIGKCIRSRTAIRLLMARTLRIRAAIARIHQFDHLLQRDHGAFRQSDNSLEPLLAVSTVIDLGTVKSSGDLRIGPDGFHALLSCSFLCVLSRLQRVLHGLRVWRGEPTRSASYRFSSPYSCRPLIAEGCYYGRFIVQV